MNTLERYLADLPTTPHEAINGVIQVWTLKQLALLL
jgi:hypothetical protein